MLQQRSKLPVAEFWDALQQEDWEFFTSCSYPTSFWREEVKLPPTRGTEIYVYEVDSLLSGPCLKVSVVLVKSGAVIANERTATTRRRW